MSTKIYNGRIIRAPIGKVYDLLIEKKPEAVLIGRNLEIAWMAIRAAEKIDKARIEGEEKKGALFEAWTEMTDRISEIKKTQRRDPAVDIECELWLFPLKDQTLVIPNSEAKDLREWFDALSFVEDYAYWDNTDPDEDVDKKTWKQRERDWNKVLPGAGVPSDRCLIFALYQGGMVFPAEPEEAIKHIPPAEKRLTKIVRQEAVAEKFQAKCDAKKKENPEWKMEGFGLYFEAEKEALSDPEFLQAKREHLKTHVREITIADLSYRE